MDAAGPVVGPDDGLLYLIVRNRATNVGPHDRLAFLVVNLRGQNAWHATNRFFSDGSTPFTRHSLHLEHRLIHVRRDRWAGTSANEPPDIARKEQERDCQDRHHPQHDLVERHQVEASLAGRRTTLFRVGRLSRTAAVSSRGRSLARTIGKVKRSAQKPEGHDAEQRAIGFQSRSAVARLSEGRAWRPMRRRREIERRGETSDLRKAGRFGSVQPFQLFQNLLRLRAIGKRRGALDVTNDALPVDDERRGPIAPFDVNSHLHRDAVGCTDDLRGVGQQRVVHIVGAEPALLKQGLRGRRFVRIDRQQLRSGFFERIELVAQLRELAMADRSGIAVDEHQHDRLFAPEITQSNLLACHSG